MLRLAARRLARRADCARGFSTSTSALAEDSSSSSSDKGTQAFVDKFTPHVSANLVRPQFPSDFLPKKEEQPKEGVPDKLTLNFYLPHKQTLKDSKVVLLLKLYT